MKKPSHRISLHPLRRGLAVTLTCLAVFITALAFPSLSQAEDVNVLIIGSSKTGLDYPGIDNGNSSAYSSTEIQTELKNILDGAGLGTVNVAFEDVFRSKDYFTASYNLASWYYWPYPAGVETTTRWPNLRGENGTVWDYVVLIGDPYTIEEIPGLYAHGVARVGEEVAKGSAEAVLLMPWPGPDSTSTVNHYKEVVYRTGRSGGYKVAPAGLAWQAALDASEVTAGGGHPNNDGAYMAAATIFSRVWGQAGVTSTYNPKPALTTIVNDTVSTNVGAPQYSGEFNFQNPFLMLTSNHRSINPGKTIGGSSTEDGFIFASHEAASSIRVGISRTSGGPQFLFGRDTGNPDGNKDYRNRGYGVRAFAYFYQVEGTSGSTEQDNDLHIGNIMRYDIELADQVASESDTFRVMPRRLLWAEFHRFFPTINPKPDGTHVNGEASRAVGVFATTLVTGRCPMGSKPSNPTHKWIAQKAGYEAAWHMGRVQSRAPGFKVLPSATDRLTVKPGTPETMTVQFMLPPKEDVTVNVSVTGGSPVTVTPNTLTFTPENHDVPQNVTVAADGGQTVEDDFNVVYTTISADEVYNDLSDSWSYTYIPNILPVAYDLESTTIKNTPESITLTGSDADNHPLTYEVVTQPDNGVLSGTAPNLTYTSSGDFTGTDSFTFRVHDGFDYSATATVSISVLSSAPVASGGFITEVDGYFIHKFTNETVNNTFTVDPGVTLDVEYLIVGGGGGGGVGAASRKKQGGGGGGAGGFVTGTTAVAAGTYNVVVGDGGLARSGNGAGNSGGNSSFAGVTAIGGGGGGGDTANAKNGGSGGGGGLNSSPGAGIAGQGNAGGATIKDSPSTGAGGGGAGGAGGNNDWYGVGGAGGDGLQSSITGTEVYYAGGGGGTTAAGGLGGGGDASGYADGSVDGINGLGGGGGAGRSGGVSGAGGSGVVIVRYFKLRAVTTDQMVTDVDGSGSEDVTLDGSGSFGGTIVDYTWNDGTSDIATGATPTVSLPVGTHTITLTVTDSEGATDTDVVVIDVTPPAVSTVAIGEVGTVSAGQSDSDEWHSVTLTNSYTNPVVVLNSSTFNGSQACVLRVKDVTANSFAWQVDEWDYLDGGHATETVHYLVVEAGTHTLQDGTVLQAGTLSVGDTATTLTFPQAFAAAPVVVSQATTVNDSRAVTTRQGSVTATGLDLFLQSEEAYSNAHDPETVGWIAMDKGVGTTAGMPFEIMATGNSVKEEWYNVPFTRNLPAAPAVLASMQTVNGADVAGLRFQNRTTTSVDVKVEEEQSSDEEVGHATEVVGLICLPEGIISVPDEGTSGSEAFNDWVAANGGGDITFTGDSNGDGVADGMSWLLGAETPSENAKGLLPQMAENGGTMDLNFKMRNVDSRGTAVLSVEYSRDLGITDPWTENTIVIPDVSSTVDGVAFTITPIDSNHNQVEVSIPTSAAGGTGKLFARIKGVLSP